MPHFRSLTGVATALVCVTLAAGSLTADGRKLAVVVGVNAYRGNSGLPTLQHAASDAAALSGALRGQGFTVYEMTHAAARQPGNESLAPNIAYIRDQIKGILGFPDLGADDAVLITFHGHGVQFEQLDDAGNKTAKFYFCPADATIAGVKTANDLTELNHLLPLDELYSQLGKCRAATKLLIVDACRNDPTQPGVFRSGLASATLPKLPPPPGGTVAFFSCKPDQRAVEDSALNQGVFTHFLVQGLNGQADLPLAGQTVGDGVITFAELSAYVANNTYAHVYDKYKVRQSPELRGDYDLNLPLARIVVTIPEGKQAGEILKFGGDLAINMCWCPAGSFVMGSPESELNHQPDERQVDVTFSRGFWLGQTEVTQGWWESVMGTNPWSGRDFRGNIRHREGLNFPAIYLSWNDANEFCRKLTERERLAGRLPIDWVYQLPTEAQWEYACRAGTTGSFNFGREKDYWEVIDDYVVSTRNSSDYAPDQVGQKQANRWGLHDMHGNAFEYCRDNYSEKLPGGRDPFVNGKGSVRVARGGSSDCSADRVRSACRYQVPWPHTTMEFDYDKGFRLALSPTGE